MPLWEVLYETEFGHVKSVMYLTDMTNMFLRLIVFDYNLIIYHYIKTNIQTSQTLMSNPDAVVAFVNNMDTTGMVNNAIKNRGNAPFTRGFLDDIIRK